MLDTKALAGKTTGACAGRVLRGLQPSSWAYGSQCQGPLSEPGAPTR